MRSFDLVNDDFTLPALRRPGAIAEWLLNQRQGTRRRSCLATSGHYVIEAAEFGRSIVTFLLRQAGQHAELSQQLERTNRELEAF